MSSHEVPCPPGLPVVGNTLSFARDPFRFIDSAVSEHGDVLRVNIVGKDHLYMVSHPDGLEQALVSDVDSFGKTADFSRAFGSGLLSTEGTQWRRQREILQPFFYPRQMKSYAEAMREQIRRRISRWSAGETRDMLVEMKNLTLEVVFATLFGRELDPVRDEDLYVATNALNNWFKPSSWALPLWLPTFARRRFHSATSQLRAEIDRLIETYGQEETQREDLLSKLLEIRATADDRRLSDEEIKDQLVTFSFAGYETTALAVSFTWYLLATHPEIRERFHAELEMVLDGTAPSPADLEKLEYTEQILTEALRLYPPIHTIPRKTTSPVEIEGYQLPAGSEVHLSLIQAHRHEEFYEQPDSFRPDRWTPEFTSDLHKFAYLPFGGGRRSCIGREFALFEAKLVLALIGQQFRLDLVSDYEFAVNLQMTTQPTDGLPMRISRRESRH